MKIIFDTVTLVRGLIDPFRWSGTLLFERADDYEWIVSPEIVAEYLEVIRRPRLMCKYLVTENRDLGEVLARIEQATLVQPIPIPSICRDPSDDKFLAAADASDADIIVSIDNDLLSLISYKGTRILTPALALEEIGHA